MLFKNKKILNFFYVSSIIFLLHILHKSNGKTAHRVTKLRDIYWEHSARADWAEWKLNNNIKWQGSSVGESARLIPVRSRVRISPLLFFNVNGASSAACNLTGHFSWTNKKIIREGWLCVWMMAVGSNRFMCYETGRKVSFGYQKVAQISNILF